MNGFFINYEKSGDLVSTGINKKIGSQIDAFNKLGINCKEYTMHISDSKYISILYRIPFSNVYPVWKNNSSLHLADYIYMRRPFVMNRAMVKFLKECKKIKDVKLLIELPTYPYDDEYNEYRTSWLLKFYDRINRKRVAKIIDRFVVLTDDYEVFGAKTIKIRNGIDLSTIPVRKYKNDGTIHLCAVAMFKDWHGYERVLYGLSAYLKSHTHSNVMIHFVGEGSELSFYKKIVESEKLNDYVVFHGFLSGAELDKIYDISAASLGAFGFYKIGLNISANLKSRESVARGLPIISGCHVDIFDTLDESYYLEFENNSNSVDFEKIISFCESIYSKESCEEVTRKIRLYAEQNLSMEICMKPVVDFLCK